jgi:hypothetical protein
MVVCPKEAYSMKHIKGGLAILGLAMACFSVTSCSHLKAVTAPTWVYKNGDARLELLNENAGRSFCLQKPSSTVCGTYEDSNSDVFSSAMAHFKRQPKEVHAPEKSSSVQFKPEMGTRWTWEVQPDGSIKDENGAVWQLAEFRQFGKTYTE